MGLAMSTITTTDDELWEAVVAGDPSYDGAFFTAVATTGIFCRPSCSARTPHRRNVSFFDSTDAAEAAGYRACLRCKPKDVAAPDNGRAKALAAARYIENHPDRIPTLDELGAEVGMSPTHLQRTFTRAIGVSPRKYADALRVERLKGELQDGTDIAGAQYGTGYGSSSRLYEVASSQLGMTPGAYRDGAPGQAISYVVVESPLGCLLVAATERGVCAVRLGDELDVLTAGLAEEFDGAELSPGGDDLAAWVQAIVGYLSGDGPLADLPFDVRATAFQRQVWEAIRAIPFGETATYSELAETIGKPSATRAVAQACAANQVALVIPCHRVVPKSGGTGGYRWGTDRKERLLEMERSEG